MRNTTGILRGCEVPFIYLDITKEPDIIAASWPIKVSVKSLKTVSRNPKLWLQSHEQTEKM